MTRQLSLAAPPTSLADRAFDVLVEQGPLPLDMLAPALRTRRTTVLAVLRSDRRFMHDGATKGSRWRVRAFMVADLAERWGWEPDLTQMVVHGFVECGYMESVDGNGRVRVTDLGRERSEAWIALGARL